MQLNWLEILYKVFEVAIIPLLAAGTVYLVTLIHTKKQELQAKVKNENQKKYIEMLDKTITECVIATNQTYVEALKSAGTFDAEAQKRAFQLTYEAILAILTDDAQEYLNEAIKDLNSYITNKIEAQVVVVKQQYPYNGGGN
jgi:predicted urease superfamily metal-dependent hydrolase